MSITTASLLKDGTIAASAGTSVSLQSLGKNLSEQKVYFDGSSVLDRSSADFSVKVPKVKADAPSGYTQARSTVFIRVPKTLPDGSVTFNTVTITVAADVASTASDVDRLRSYGAQALAAADFDAFWQGQSVE
jgi:hypothetical protein